MGEQASVSFDSIKTELDNAVGEATNFVDLVDKYADVFRTYAKFIPGGTGAEVATAINALDTLDKALHDAQSALNAV